MSSINKMTEKHLMVFSGRAHPQLAQDVADALGTELARTARARRLTAPPTTHPPEKEH